MTSLKDDSCNDALEGEEEEDMNDSEGLLLLISELQNLISPWLIHISFWYCMKCLIWSVLVL